MSAPAAHLYRQDLAWQGAPVAPRKPGGKPKSAAPKSTAPSAGDPPAVSLPKSEDIEDHPTVKLGKAWYGLAATQALVLTVVIGAYFGISGRLDRQDSKIEAITNWLKDPKTFPGTKGLNAPDDDPQSQAPLPAPPGSTAPVLAPAPASAVPVFASANPPSAPAPGLRAFPSSIPPTSPPECVSSKVFRKMACEQAVPNTCRGLPSFAPERYREIRLQAGVGEYMLVCDPK